jgi:hypothetical protein
MLVIIFCTSAGIVAILGFAAVSVFCTFPEISLGELMVFASAPIVPAKPLVVLVIKSNMPGFIRYRAPATRSKTSNTGTTDPLGDAIFASELETGNILLED